MSGPATVTRCPVCGGRIIVAPEGHRVCSECGYVVEEAPMSYRLTRRQLQAETRLTERLGRSRKAPRFRTYEARRLITPRSSSVDRALRRAAALASTIIGVSTADIEEARRIMAETAGRIPLNGSINLVIVAVAALILVKEGKMSTKAMVKAFSKRLGVAPKRLWHVIRRMRLAEGMKPPAFLASVSAALNTAISRLELGDKAAVYRDAIRLVEERRMHLGSRSPSAVAAAALFLAARLHGYEVTMKSVSAAVGVSEAAARSARKALERG